MERRSFLKMSGGAAVAVTSISGSALVAGCSTDWIATVIADIPVVVNIINSVVAVVAQATGSGSLPANVAAELTTAMYVAMASLNAFQDAANAYNANKSQGNLTAMIRELDRDDCGIDQGSERRTGCCGHATGWNCGPERNCSDRSRFGDSNSYPVEHSSPHSRRCASFRYRQGSAGGGYRQG